MEQKETVNGLVDEECGREALAGQAGLCVVHYKEYLVGLINRSDVDPVVVFDVDQMKLLFERVGKAVPEALEDESADEFKLRVRKLVQEEMPLCPHQN